MFFEICTLALHLLIYVGELDNENENEKLLDDLSSTLSWSDKGFKGTVVNRALHGGSLEITLSIHLSWSSYCYL